mgnify:CR=1 FL=1
MSCRNCSCAECVRARAGKAADSTLRWVSYKDEFCGTCGGLKGGNWTNGGCTCGLRRDDGEGGYGPNHR